MAGGAALAALIAVPLSIAAFMGVDSSFPGIDAAKSFMALLDDRSPGDRTAAELTKTKKKAPEERALGKITKPEPPPEFVEAIAPVPPPTLAEVPPFPVALAGLGPLVEIPPLPPGGGGFITTTDTGGGGAGGTDNPEKPPENPPPPVVPEPATWATMLLGFGLTGWLMRRRRRLGSAASWA